MNEYLRKDSFGFVSSTQKTGYMKASMFKRKNLILLQSQWIWRGTSFKRRPFSGDASH